MPALNRCEECGNPGASRDDGLCTACRLVEEGEIETREEYFKELGSRGGQANAADTGLHPADLGPLETVEDVKRWLKLTAQAAACETLDPKAANSVVRALKQWREAHGEAELEEELEELREQVAELMEYRDRKRVA